MSNKLNEYGLTERQQAIADKFDEALTGDVDIEDVISVCAKLIAFSIHTGFPDHKEEMIDEVCALIRTTTFGEWKPLPKVN